MNARNPATSSPWQKMLGIELSPVSHRERLGFRAGRYCRRTRGLFGQPRPRRPAVDAAADLFIGASTVLVFAVPHGSLSQPWPVFGGHLVSALIGVACARLVPDAALAAAMAVGLSISAMQLPALHTSTRRGNGAGCRSRWRAGAGAGLRLRAGAGAVQCAGPAGGRRRIQCLLSHGDGTRFS